MHKEGFYIPLFFILTMIEARGIKAVIISLGTIFIIIVLLLLVFNFLVLLLPLIIVIFLMSYSFKVLNKLKKEKPEDYLDVHFKVK